MKLRPALAAAFLISMPVRVVLGDCSYFRVSTALLKCGRIDPKSEISKDPYPSSSDSLDLDEASSSKPLMQIRCECSYSLKGADPLCDPDQTVERRSVVGDDHPEETCRRGRSLCKDVCPARLP